eukprot:TRINITY_DN5349_c0_g1_i1.p1 TRINITY_DN5349_c0_g1~~TRINITY_DN5349_c0_g1_i1.p1  ORF type:complete len:184 (-),score=44.69 TRINITY_DN5349_c0_g1_i1:149-664(-)
MSDKPSNMLPVAKLNIETREGENSKRVTEYLGRMVEITTTDGRVFTGRFRSFDNNKNIILSETSELKKVTPVKEPFVDLGPEPEEEDRKKDYLRRKEAAQMKMEERKKGLERKNIGLALVPGRYIVRCLLDENSQTKAWVGRSRRPSLRDTVPGPDTVSSVTQKTTEQEQQ